MVSRYEPSKFPFLFLISPNKKVSVEHARFLDLSSKRIQVNVEVIPVGGIDALEHIKEYMVFPLIWADEVRTILIRRQHP